MKLSRRSLREWRIILWLSLGCILLSAIFGYLVGRHSPIHAVLMGAANSLAIATPILLFEVKGRRSAALRRLRRQPLLVYFGFSVAFYVAAILGGLVLVRILLHEPEIMPFDRTFRISIVFAVAMSVVSNAIKVIGFLLGFGTLRNLLAGHYVKPRREQKAFLLIDMRDSTGIAERLGPVRFHELLNDFFRDIADAALECDAEIHKYVGDEVILTWPKPDSDTVACPFIARDFIAASARRYRERFGVVPEFRAAMHYGEIVAGEIGDVRREIAYVGDTLNVAARLLDASKTLGRDVLVSADLLGRVTLPPDLRAEVLPTLTVRGRNAPLAISALERT